jgi:GTP-binding protein
MLPIVAIVGRPNVGKSTLFNRVLGHRQAIVDELPGLTRDRHYAEAEWSGRRFLLVDTGGIDPESPHPIQRQILQQTEFALEEADVTLLVVDALAGPTPVDFEVAARVRRQGRPSLLLVNKADHAKGEEAVSEFYALGLGDPVPVSALHGRGAGDVLDAVLERLPRAEEAPEETAGVRIAVLGRPNVGKSSIVNRLVGAARMVVDPVAGTTRDAVDTTIQRGEQTFVLVDTAGLRRTTRITDPVEYYSVTRALKAVSRSDIVLLVVDVSREPSRQDARLASVAAEERKGIVVVFNKWDLVDDPEKARGAIEEAFHGIYPFLDHAPRLYVSALSGSGCGRILPACEAVHREYTRTIETAELNRAVHAMVDRVRPPATSAGRHLKFYYATQTGVRPPTFAMFVNNPRYLSKNYVSYLERKMREQYGFAGSPILFDWKRSA